MATVDCSQHQLRTASRSPPSRRSLSPAASHIPDRASPSPTPSRRKISVNNIRQVYDRVQRYLAPDAAASDSSGTINTSSPVNKRRGFSSRKWLPPPLRKLSQGKVEKGQNNTSDRPPPLKKTGSDKRFKLPSDMGNKPVGGEGETETEEDTSTLANGATDEPEEELELPPPMKPLQEPLLVTPAPPIAATAAIAEDSREQHTENQERNSFLRDCKPSDTLPECDETVEEVAEGSAETGENGGEINNTDEITGAEAALRKREFVIRELAESEETYVKDLAQIVDGYLTCMRDPSCSIPLPEDLKGTKTKMVFGNIEAIYEWHRDCFSKALRRCVEHPAELGPLFRRCERKLHMYVVYCQNKPVSEHIVSEHLDGYFEELRQFLGHKLQICDLLIKPVQRITKYQLLLREALACTERAGLAGEITMLRGAMHVMHVVPKAANDMMDVGRLQGFDGKLSAQGRLLLHGLLMCSETPSGQKREFQVFLFEQCVIFSDAVGKKTQFTSPVYVYKGHLQVNKMAMEELVGGAFTLKSNDPRKPGLQYTCEAATPELKTQWLRTLHAIIQTQKDFLKALQSPIDYQKKLTKDANSTSDLSAIWNPTLRKTSSAPVQPNNRTPRKSPNNRPGLLQGFRNSLSRRWSDADPPGQPRLSSKPPDVIVPYYGTAILQCKLEPSTTDLHAIWRRCDKNPTVMRPSDRIHLEITADSACLTINDCRDSDSGTYQCTISNNTGSIQCTINLTVEPCRQLQVEIISCSSVALSYESKNVPCEKWIVEYCEAGTAHWLTATGVPRNGRFIVEHLVPGTSYAFRVNGNQPSPTVSLPPADSSRRAQEQFHRRYAEGEEISRGRYSIVRTGTDRGTGQRVALKQAWRARRSKSATKAEYALLAAAEHPHLVRAVAMFEHAPQPGMDTIVLELVRGPPILEHLCRSTHYTETEVCVLSRQIAGALAWLHSHHTPHRDLRPENVLVDTTGPVANVRLIDLGAASGLAEPPACLECTAPERILALRSIDKIVSYPADVWSLGVLIYVMLSGVSPFLDDSDEETTANVLKCDFCFPDEYFAGVSEEAKELITKMLILEPGYRIIISACLESSWMLKDVHPCLVPSSRLLSFVERRRPGGSAPSTPTMECAFNDD